MTTEQLNRMLVDYMGTAVNGGPAFRWMRSEDLMFLVRTGTNRVIHEAELLSAVEDIPECEYRRQCKTDNWVLAKWIAPPPIAEWEQHYGHALGYPHEGYWFMIQPLRPGAEPDENLTAWCADQLNWQRELGFAQTLSLVMEQEARIERDNKARSDAMIDQLFTHHIPGVRGGSFSAPLTKFDR